MAKLNKSTRIGLVIFALTLLLKRLIDLPDFIHGLGVGSSIIFMLIGVYAVNHDISKLKNLKLNFLKKCFNK